MITTLIIASTLLAASSGFNEAHEYRFMTNSGPQALVCGLFVPYPIQPTQRYPLLVWLECDANWYIPGSQLKVLFGPDYAHVNLGKYPFFIVSVPVFQALKRYPGGPRDDAYLVYRIVQKTMREYPIDPDRVYLAGVSRGGHRCWEMAMRYPELFAAVVPMGAPGPDVSRADKLKVNPIWAFHNLNDTAVAAEGDMQMAAAIKSKGGNICLTLPPSRGHDCWTAAFQKDAVMAWMLEQRRGAVCWRPPGYPPWKWWHILLLPCTALALVRLAWHFRQKRR